jgi:hypothetical protein
MIGIGDMLMVLDADNWQIDLLDRFMYCEHCSVRANQLRCLNVLRDVMTLLIIIHKLQ